jgi:hypothetical protein
MRVCSDSQEIAEELQSCPQGNAVNGEVSSHVMHFSVRKCAVLDAQPASTVRSHVVSNSKASPSTVNGM